MKSHPLKPSARPTPASTKRNLPTTWASFSFRRQFASIRKAKSVILLLVASSSMRFCQKSIRMITKFKTASTSRRLWQISLINSVPTLLLKLPMLLRIYPSSTRLSLAFLRLKTTIHTTLKWSQCLPRVKVLLLRLTSNLRMVSLRKMSAIVSLLPHGAKLTTISPSSLRIILLTSIQTSLS